MTKAQIREDYNWYGKRLRDALERYKELTGKEFEHTFSTEDMTPDAVMDYKDDLERRLIWRKCNYRSVLMMIDEFKREAWKDSE